GGHDHLGSRRILRLGLPLRRHERAALSGGAPRQTAGARAARVVAREGSLPALRRPGAPRGDLPVLLRARRAARRDRALQVDVLRRAVDSGSALLRLVARARRSLSVHLSALLPISVPPGGR